MGVIVMQSVALALLIGMGMGIEWNWKRRPKKGLGELGTGWGTVICCLLDVYVCVANVIACKCRDY